MLFDFAFPTEEANQIREVSIAQNGPMELTGHVRQSNQYAPDYTLYFVVQLDKAIGFMDAWRREEPRPGMYGDLVTPVAYEKKIAKFHARIAAGSS